MTKIQAKGKQHLQAELFLFENYSLSSSALSSKNNMHILKDMLKNKGAHFSKIMWLIVMKMKMKNRSNIDDYIDPI